MDKYFIKLFQKIIKHSMYFLYNWLNIKDFEYRKLTEGEIQIAKKVFHDLINYDEVKVFNVPYVPWQPIDVFIAPNGNLFINKENFCEDYSKCSLVLQGLFIHELTHILQYQQFQNVILKGMLLQSAYFLSLKKYNPYKYEFVQGKSFSDYNIEQQAEIARDIFLKKIPNIIIHA